MFNNLYRFSGVAKGRGGGEGGDRPQSQKNHSLKKAKSVEKLGGGDTLHVMFFLTGLLNFINNATISSKYLQRKGRIH